MTVVNLGPKTLIAGGAVAMHARVKIDNSTGKATVCGASDRSNGISATSAAADGDKLTVTLPNQAGTRKMIASGAITQFVKVYAAAAGKIASSGTIIEGIAWQAATEDGHIIEVWPISEDDLEPSATIADPSAPTAYSAVTDMTDPVAKAEGEAVSAALATLVTEVTAHEVITSALVAALKAQGIIDT